MQGTIKEYRDKTTNVASDMFGGVAQAQGDGGWLGPFRSWDKINIHVIITGTATVVILGSNEGCMSNDPDPAPPANDDNAITLGTFNSTDALTDKSPFTWLKAKVTAYTDGDVQALLNGV